MSKTVEALGSSRTLVAPYGVMRVVPSEKQTKIVGDGIVSGEGSEDGIKSPTFRKVGIAFTSVTLALGAILVGLYTRSGRRGRKVVDREQTGDYISLWGYLPRGRSVQKGDGTLAEDGSLICDDSLQTGSESIYLRDITGAPEFASRRVMFQFERGLENEMSNAARSYSDSDDSITPPHLFLD